MEAKVNYLPLGSIVIVNGGIRKYVIVARGIQVKIDGKEHLFDYGGCRYPEGMVGDQMMYFQHSNIEKVIFTGYSDEDNELMVKNIQNAVQEQGLTHTDVKELKNKLEN